MANVDILIIEDDPATFKALPLLLKSHGWTTELVSTKNDGIVALEHNPKFLLLDLMLPNGDDGTDVIEYVRKNQLKTICVITTGVADPDWIKRTEQFQPDLILTKPIDPNELINFIKDHYNE